MTALARSRRASAVGLTVLLFAGTVAWHPLDPETSSDRGDPKLIIRLNGKFVHNVGRLQLQITNIGQTGNVFNPNLTTVPSAEWPQGSGLDYLYAAGLWVGAIDVSGIPHVTTALYDREFSPEIVPTNPCAPVPLDQVADVRESYEGIPGGNRIVSSSLNPDDDGDGLVDEDFLNGLDDDHDGRCDEDYSAVSQQMFSTEYFDDLPQTRQAFPEHVALGIRVRQTSYAWGNPGQNDFVGMDYVITNRSGRTLRNIMIGIMADPDIGSRAFPNIYNTDDQVGLFDRDVQYIGQTGEVVTRRMQMAYAYDNPDNPAAPQENKGGDAPGYFGCIFLNHTVDPTGLTAPTHVGITSFKYFSGSGSFATGGDPENDVQRYQLMTDPTLDPNVTGPVASSRPVDYRFLMATGPFRTLLPESSLTISVGWVMGLGLGAVPGGPPLEPSGAIAGSLVANAVVAQQIFDGVYTDFDGKLTTGTCGKETCLQTPEGTSFVYQNDNPECTFRFHGDYFPPWDSTRACEVQQGGRFVCVDQETPILTHCASADTLPVRVNGPQCIYVDQDCDVKTGQDGREYLAHWVAASPLPAPYFAALEGHSEPRDFMAMYDTPGGDARVSAWFFPGDRKVTLKWSNFSEQIRDAQRGNLKEFIGYRIYKAAGWDRPIGSNGPAKVLWSLLGEWRIDPGSTAARPLSEIIDVSAPLVRITPVTVTWDWDQRRSWPGGLHTENDTLFAVGRYSYEDRHVLNGFPYFYSIAPLSIVPGPTPADDIQMIGNPNATNAQVVYPRSDSQDDQDRVFVVPNPYRAVAEWDLVPREEDPSGTKVTFHNLPRTKGTIHVFTLSGDLVRDLPFDGTLPPDTQFGKDPLTKGAGQVSWNLISRNGQKIVSGVYLYSVDSDLGRDVGKFVVIR